MEKLSTKSKKGFFYYVEKGGNALPHPALLFGIFALTIFILSGIGSLLGWQGVHPATGKEVEVFNLMSRDGIHFILLSMVKNYTSFAPLGIVMVAMLGIGIAEHSGLVKSAINAMLAKTPPHLITVMIVFTAVLSKVAGDLGYLLIIPLSGVIFHSVGRNPLVGMSAAFAGVSGGFSANFVITSLDPLLAGLTQEAAQILDPNYVVLPTANYYFMATSAVMVTIVATVVTVKWVEPRLGRYTGDVPQEEIAQPTKLEKKGLRNAGLCFLAWFVLLGIGLVPENGVLRGAGGGLLNSPALIGFISLLFLTFATAGAVYGFTVGKYKKGADVMSGMNESMKSLAAYLVLVFFAAQFIAWFKESNLGIMLAINGATFLKNADIGLIPLVILFILFTAMTNFLMGSASAKWAIMGPVFVPIFMLLGYSPELSQAVFRIGDSITNIISPMMSFFALIIVYYQKYDKKAGIGTIVATMLPYTITFFICWTALLIIWIVFNLPLGPGVSLYYGM
ncbi:MAG: AbgT family transporter [Bacteroidetes bacterium]|nr:AbgT family transporter [Bacteroidota bacterium]MCL2303312.1 AbgT family transporter [Lentimicrobiaceae bacterium]